ncbi:porin [Alteromonas lipolytica]|uniref:Uncharacterized protein n=1 Tax=Alteromonas lipolytica TaxID=1856405 RepID=A0A1E8FA30_9ALTE|nr:porin [Alteromonas lipolytica]OFI32765.1 hypothetical protein BFC17_06335 [Alteromonas lipolytica]GGF73266.1 outer membrane beta barrel protein [Alteromonas lipolytica]
MNKFTLLQLAPIMFCLSAPVLGDDDFPVNIGGHVRLNYSYQDWPEPELRDGFGFESLKLTVSGETDEFSYQADYRWYENTDFNTVRYADLTYHVDERTSVSAGITKVPFGLLPFASNSFWFSINYYLGFEDDYDAGMVVQYERANWNFQAGYFFNDEYNDASRLGRYSFDIADDGSYRNQEDGQYNLRLSYTAGLIRGATTEVGASLQKADVLNLDTLDKGDMRAYALHVRHTQGPVVVALQYTDYDYDLAAPQGQATDRLALSAFDFPFLVAADAHSYTASVSYQLPFEFNAFTPIKCYSEYGSVEPDVAAGLRSSQWVNGCSFGWRSLYFYVDSIQGKNMWFSGGSGIGLNLGGNQDTTHRLNISLGLYF